MLFEDLDIYEARVEEDNDGIFAISLVEYPAVESNFMCFKDNKELVKFAVQDSEEHLISGVIMLADSLIYRRNGDYEYWITYSKDTIKKMAQKMLSDGTFNNIDLQHDGKYIPGVSLVELYIKDENKGLNPNFVSEIPDGSLMGTFHVEDDELWDEIKNGDALKGFSLEGLFTVEKVNNQKINTDMSKVSKFFKNLMKFEEIAVEGGKLFWDEGELEIGKEVYVESDGEKVAAADGEYLAEDKVIVVSEGKVSEIRIKEEEPKAEEEVIEVNASKQRFEKVKAAFEESYEDKERKIIEAIRAKGFDCWLVEAGDDYAIVEIWVDETADYKHYRFGVTWDEEGNCSVSDPEEVKSEFVPVDEVPAEEPKAEEEVVVEKFEDETVVEVEPEPEPQPEERDEKEERIAKLEDDLAALKQELADLKASVAEYIQKPAAAPITEEFAKAIEVETSGLSKGQSKAASLASYLRK